MRHDDPHVVAAATRAADDLLKAILTVPDVGDAEARVYRKIAEGSFKLGVQWAALHVQTEALFSIPPLDA